jgi:hypothetical protein
MPRKNLATHGRRRTSRPAPAVPEPDAATFEDLARSLVKRGLAPRTILDNQQALHDSTEEN